MTNNDIVPSGFDELDRLVAKCKSARCDALGYPVNHNMKLTEFYRWYFANGMEQMLINNATDPFGNCTMAFTSTSFEREVIEYFAPKYGYDLNDLWGLITMCGTDGNNHGIYFGVGYLKNKTGRMPIVYVSDEAHYSNLRLCDLQHLDVRVIASDDMGRMRPDALEAALDPSRPCLIIYAMGSTFKGAIDDQPALNAVLARHPEMEVYRHIDAALFGGYLPFTEYRDLVNRRANDFNSISISGHKFFGIDSPCGLFLTTREVYDNQQSFDIPYLNSNMRMINCSRSGLEPLKFWWLIKTVGNEGWTEQASRIMETTEYLKDSLKRIGRPYWCNQYSNTVFFPRPSKEIVRRFNLANSRDEALGGALSHVVVMQHVDHSAVDRFIAALQSDTMPYA